MKVGIDARMYGPKWGGGGLGRYVEELVAGLQRIDSEHRFVVFLKPENFDACDLTSSRFEKVIVDAHWYTAREQLLMPLAVRKAKVDLMHYPHWNVPIWSSTPFVVTIHDLILLDDPLSAKATTLGPVRYFAKRLGYHHVLHHAIEKSQKIVAVSQATKDSILHHFKHVPPTKIDVIYEGVSLLNSVSEISEKAPAARHGEAGDRAVYVHTASSRRGPVTQQMDFFRDLQPYFLYVGSAYPHKNLESLLHAFSFFITKYPLVKLVLVGKKDLFYDQLRDEVKEIGIPEDRVVFTGFVPDDQLAALYQNAALYVFPARFEGFGLPPLEAMLHGAPVAASSRGPLPEVLGDAAIYFDPDDLEQMAEVMERALNNESLRAELQAKGREQVKKYSWDSMAGQTMKLYEKVGGKK